MTPDMMTRDEVLQALEETRRRARELVTSLPEAALDVPWHPGVNPPLWEMGHAAFFYEVFVFGLLDDRPSLHPAMDPYWDSFHIEHRERWNRNLFPGREDTLNYFDTVYGLMAQRIRTQPCTDRALYLYRYAIYHQHMHIESMIWCRQTVGYPAPPEVTGVRPAPGVAVTGDAEIPPGTWWIGMPADSAAFAGDDFAFDNEKPGFVTELPAFAISRQLVSNGEFLAFVEDGGYRRPELWSFGGQQWLAKAWDHPGHPICWRQDSGTWYQRRFDQWQPLNPEAPVVHVSCWEAEAYCNWAGRRLPTEVEWEVAALGNRPGAPVRRYPWGNQAPDKTLADMDGGCMAGNPVWDYPDGDSPFGCRQMIGSVWEWTSSQFLPYDGFRVDMYPFMSTLQFGDHRVARGGSCATSSCLIRGSYRQAYLPARNDVYTGFRTCAL